MGDIQLKFAGSSADAERAIAKLEKKLDELENKLAQVSKKSKAQGESVAQTLDKWGKKALSIATAYNVIEGAIQGVISSNREMLAEADQLAEKYDDLRRRLSVQSGEAIGANQGFIDQVALDYAVPRDELFEASKTLKGAGFVDEKSLPELVKFKLSTASEMSLSELAKPIAQTLKAYGVPTNAAGIAQHTRDYAPVYKFTDVQAEHESELAKVGSLAKNSGIDHRQLLATFAATYDVIGSASEVATVLKGSALRLAAPDPSGLAAFKKLGLDRRDVDLHGESFLDAMDRIEASLAKLDPEERTAVAKDIFKSEGIAGALSIMGRVNKARSLIHEMENQPANVIDVEVEKMTTGLAAETRRAAIRREIAVEKEADPDRFVKDTIDAISLERGAGGLSRWAIKQQYDLMRSVGFSPESALKNMPLGDTVGTTGETLDLLRGIERNSQPRINRNGQVE